MENICRVYIRILAGVRRFSFIIIFGWVILFSVFNSPPLIHGAELGDIDHIKSLTVKIRSNPGDNDARWGLARTYFELAGFKEYFQAKSWLWTENSFRKAALSSKLPQVLPQAAQNCREQLLAILDRNPDNGLALTMAGDYHYFYNQKEIALWYYRRAVELSPDSKDALLALADFYLSEWQPTKVLELLSKNSGPDFAIRKGVSWIQLNEYQLALGYLLQAEPLPSWLQVTKGLNLYKAYLTLGDYSRCNNHFQTENFPGVIPATLFKELQGWTAFLANDFKTAERLWNEGTPINPDYYFWQSNQLGKRFPTLPDGTQNVPLFKRNNFLQATSWILQGYLYAQKSDPGFSYQAFLAGIKADHLSLVGFLAASRVLFQKQEYQKALDMLNQGLAVNSKFGPLLSERADVYQKLGRFNEAKQDREAARLNTRAGQDGTARLSLFPAWKVTDKSANESVNIVIRGDTQDLTGFWISGNGVDWDWVPYWGGPIMVPSRFKQGWWLPVGPGLSGQAYYLDNLITEIFQKPIDPPRVTDDGGFVVLKFPVPVKLVIRINQGNFTENSHVSEGFGLEHTVPTELFGPGNQMIDCWFQTMNGVWNRISFHITLPGDRNQTAPESRNSIENLSDESTESTSPPKLSSVMIADELPGYYKIIWSTDQAVSSWLRVLSERGQWSEIPAIIDPYGRFTGWVPKTAVFGRIALKSEAGDAVVYYSAPELNRRLGQNRLFRFIVNDGSILVNSRNITIKLETDNDFPVADQNTGESPEIQWSISNDQRVWSPWHQGFKTRQWRFNSGEGEQLVYIRYKLTGDPSPAKIAVIPVALDTLPPELKIFDWQLRTTTGSQTKMMVIRFTFNEPVLLRSIIPETGTSVAGKDNNSNDFQPKITVELPVKESPISLELAVTDQAGNETRFWGEASTAGLYQKSDDEIKNR